MRAKEQRVKSIKELFHIEIALSTCAANWAVWHIEKPCKNELRFNGVQMFVITQNSELHFCFSFNKYFYNSIINVDGGALFGSHVYLYWENLFGPFTLL
jgi:hypothetical protein